MTINVHDFLRLRRSTPSPFAIRLLPGERGGPVCALVMESHWAVVIYMHGVHLHTGLKQQDSRKQSPWAWDVGVCSPSPLCVSFLHLRRKEKFVLCFLSSLLYSGKMPHPGFPSTLVERNLENLSDWFPELEMRWRSFI